MPISKDNYYYDFEELLFHKDSNIDEIIFLFFFHDPSAPVCARMMLALAIHVRSAKWRRHFEGKWRGQSGLS